MTTGINTHITSILLATCLLGINACSSDQTDKAQSPSVFQDQINTLDKARGVEKTLQDNNERQRTTIDEQSR